MMGIEDLEDQTEQNQESIETKVSRAGIFKSVLKNTALCISEFLYGATIPWRITDLMFQLIGGIGGSWSYGAIPPLDNLLDKESSYNIFNSRDSDPILKRLNDNKFMITYSIGMYASSISLVPYVIDPSAPTPPHVKGGIVLSLIITNILDALYQTVINQ